MKLPENESEVREFLEKRVEDVKKKDWDQGLCYVNGFYDGVAFAKNTIQKTASVKVGGFWDELFGGKDR